MELPDVDDDVSVAGRDRPATSIRTLLPTSAIAGDRSAAACNERERIAPNVARNGAIRLAYCALRAGFLCFLILSTTNVYANSAIEQWLREWIEKDMHFFVDAQKHDVLFLRRQPIRASIYSSGQSVSDDAKLTIELFSRASELPLEFTSTNPNIIIYIGPRINDGDKPNRELFRKFALSDIAYEAVSSGSGWAAGCGIYSFADNQGQVSLSLSFADTRLPPATIKNCIIEGIIHAFGLRAHSTVTIRSGDGYLQYVMLAKALHICDRKSRSFAEMPLDGATLKKRYLECAIEYLKAVL